MPQSQKSSLWHDRRFLAIASQALVLALVLGLFSYFGFNLSRNLSRLGLNFGFDFLTRPASFDLADPPFPFAPTDPYYKAILVGLINSLKITLLGIVIATCLGILIGIGRLSRNWLVSKISSIYIEVLRNTPLLLQLFFWYFAVFLKLPKVDTPLAIADKIFLTNRGVYFPSPDYSGQTVIFLGLFLVVLTSLTFYLRSVGDNRNLSFFSSSSARLLVTIFSILILVAIWLWGIGWDVPQPQAQSIQGGVNFSPEFATLLFGLSLYTASFIAEVVRAGVQSIGVGQWEAAKSLGLKTNEIMQLIIFPQALRVMIPPLTSEFLNLAKNSSLAIAIGYSDVYAIANTISNQTGKAIEMLIVIISIYLTINLLISLIMNRINNSTQFER